MAQQGEVFVLIAAAGAARRMQGADKLLQPVGGVALLRRLAAAALRVAPRVLVTLPESDAAEARRAALAGLALRIIPVPDAAEGMAASLRAAAAVAAAEAAAGLLVVLGDMPEIEAADMQAMLAAFHRAGDAPVLRAASADGRPGNPVLLPAWMFDEIATLSGDTGARELLRRHDARVRLVALPGNRALIDLDTPQDWAEWRVRSGL